MKSRFDMIKEIGTRRALALVGASFAPYTIAMLTISLVAQPPAHNGAASASVQAERVALHLDTLVPTELDLI